MQKFTEMFELSIKEKKGITFYLGGQTVGGLVLRYDGETVEVRNQQYSRVVVRIDRIDAIAAN